MRSASLDHDGWAGSVSIDGEDVDSTPVRHRNLARHDSWSLGLRGEHLVERFGDERLELGLCTKSSSPNLPATHLYLYGQASRARPHSIVPE